MRIASGLGKGHHVLTVTIFLIVAVIVVGAAACDGAGTYQLAISCTSGGNVTAPGEGTFPYPAGTLVQLLAAPNDGYQFGSWTGDIEHIANPNAASTTITMSGNYAIVANFGTDGGTGPDDGGHTQP